MGRAAGFMEKAAHSVDRKQGTTARNWATGGRKSKEEKQNTKKRERYRRQEVRGLGKEVRQKGEE